MHINDGEILWLFWIGDLGRRNKIIENNRMIIESVKKKKTFTIDELIADIPSDYKKEKELFSEPMGKEIW